MKTNSTKNDGYRLFWFFGGAFLASWVVATAIGEVKSPLTPEESLKLFQLPDDVQIDIAAAEPEVVDPVAIRFDEAGRMWVVEMRDYPLGPKEGQPPLSRIRILSDKDGDGRYETSVVFAEKLLFITGLQPWRGGVFVTLSGRLAYMKDTNGDGRADVDETWFTGFAEQNTQLRANHPRLALNGWIYVANGLKGGRIKNHRVPDSEEVAINGMDFRFHPQTGVCEAVTGNGQFGLTFDDWGNRFVCSNRKPLQHVVFENDVLKQHPTVTVAAVMNDVMAAAEQSRVFPISRAWTTSNLHAGQFTAACGCSIYRGDALPQRYRGQPFVCDPTGNLVHWEIMEPSGGTFTAKPGLEGKEFLASPDEWFRPVNLETGPDGALYVVDMHRAVIEHPDFVPKELKQRPDERWGEDRGRIYRLSAKGWKRPALQLPVEKKVEVLESANGWRRDTARRLLWEAAYAGESEAAQFTANFVKRAEQPSQGATLYKSLLAGQVKTSDAIAVGESHGNAPWFRIALRMAVAKEPVEPLAAWMKSSSTTPVILLSEVAAHLGQHSRDEQLQQIAAAIVGQPKEMLTPRTMAVLGALAPQLAKRKPVVKLADLAAEKDRGEWQKFLAALGGKAEQIAADEKSSEENALLAIQYLPLVENGVAILEKLVNQKLPQPLQIAAITAFARVGNETAWGKLLDRVPQESPQIRRAILDRTLGNNARVAQLFDRIAAEKIRVTELEPTLTNRLLQVTDPALKKRAQQLLAAAIPADRAEALARYQPALNKKGDPMAGKQLFQKNCATCHRVGGEGVNVAPDISDTRTKTHAQLMTDILQPNRAIDANFVAYTVALDSGEVVSGILSAETATSITIRQPGDKTIVIPRSEISILKSTGVSLMPEGLERNITVDQMADLLSFLKNWRYLDGKTPFQE